MFSLQQQRFKKVSYFLMLFLIAGSFLLFLGGCKESNKQENTRKKKDLSKGQLNENEFFEVEYVPDGDTFYLKNGKKVRFIGIDAPELAHPNQEEEPWAKESTEYLKELLKGQSVRLVYDIKDHDQYGRELCYVYLRSGVFVNKTIVEKGWAKAVNYKPNVAQKKVLFEAERLAKESNLGLWQFSK